MTIPGWLRTRRGEGSAGTGIRLLLVATMAGGLAGACDVHSPLEPGAVFTLTVSPNPTLEIFETQQFVALAQDADGEVVEVSPTWSVVEGGGAITSTGLFTAGTVPGVYTSTVQAVSGGHTATATVTVVVGPLATITVTPDPQSLAINATQQYTAVGHDAGGNVVALTPVWTVVAGGGAISGTGSFTAGTVAGSFPVTVRATSGSLTGSASVTVTAGSLASIVVSPDPESMQVTDTQLFTAIGYDASGNVVAITPVWSIMAGGGTINTGGTFTAGNAPGTFANTVRATSGAISGDASVTVMAGGLATITVTPNPQTLDVNESQLFTAVGRDAQGNVVPITPVWSVENGGGTINTGGTFTAGTTPGTYAATVRATSGAINGSATVTVNAGGLASITVTPNPRNLAYNETQQFTAVGRDDEGNVVPINPVWTVENGGGSISSSGLFTAGTVEGSFVNTVRARSGSISGYATVNVSQDALATITVTPDPDTLQVRGQRTFTAVGRDGDGDIVPITPTWSVVNGGGSINNNGRFTAGNNPGDYNNTVRARADGVNGFATVVVEAASPPPPPLIDLGNAETHGILAGSTITCVALGTIEADASIFPGSAFSGFPPCTITGQQHAADAFAQAAQNDLTAAYNQLDLLPCGATITSNLGGQTLQPGVYCSTSSVGLTGEMFFDALGDPNATLVIKAQSTLTTAGAQVTLLNNAQARNIYWLVESSATIGLGSAMKGNIIAFQSITLNTGATLEGRALARNGAVTLSTGNTITLP